MNSVLTAALRLLWRRCYLKFFPVKTALRFWPQKDKAAYDKVVAAVLTMDTGEFVDTYRRLATFIDRRF